MNPAQVPHGLVSQGFLNIDGCSLKVSLVLEIQCSCISSNLSTQLLALLAEY